VGEYSKRRQVWRAFHPGCTCTLFSEILTTKVDVPVKETAASGCRKRHPFHHRPTRAPGRFNLFLGFSRQESQGLSLHSRLSPTFSTSLLPPLPPSSEGPILGSTSSTVKMGSLPIYLRSWLAVYIGPCSQPVFALSHRPPSSPSPFILPLRSSVSKLWLLLSLHPGPGFKSCHCNPFLSLAVHIGLILCLARRH
jgi:hypothetical protein